MSNSFLISLTDRSAFKEAMNDALEIDARRVAVVTIDLQRKYLDQDIGESLVEPHVGARIMESHRRLLTAARRAGIPVVHAYVVRRPDELDGTFPRGVLPYIRAAAAIGASQLPDRDVTYRPDRVAGSPQGELMPELSEDSDFHVSTKKSWDSFQYTDLDHLLRWTLEVDTLLVTGVNTDTCVYSTVLSAGNRGYRPVVVSDCVGSMRGEDSHLMALELMARSVAWVLSVDAVLDKLQASAGQH